MSGFNLDFSGMFNSGAFALDPSKFDFSAYAPKKETVTDPVDVVSNNTPDAQVDILEGAGTVAITKADSIEQAIQSVQPTLPDLTVSPTMDLGMDFSVAPIDTTELKSLSSLNPQYVEAPSAVSEEGTYQSWGNDPNYAASGTGFDVNFGDEGSALSNYFNQKDERFDDTTEFVGGLKSDVFSGIGVAPLEQSLFADSKSVMTSSGQANAVDYGFIENLNQMLQSDNASQYAEQMTTKASDFFGDTPDNYQTEYNALDYLKDLGVSNDNGKFTVAGKYGGYSVYDYDSETNQFVKTDDKESSFIDATLPVVADALIMYVVTAGIGNALSTSSTIAGISGGNAAVAKGIGHGLSSGLTTAATGGNTEDILLNTTLGGLGGYTEGVSEAQELAQANVDNLSVIANSSVAGESLIAQSQLANATATLKEINATAEIVNTINTTVDLAQAIDQKDALSIVNGALALSNMSSSQTLVSDKIKETFEEGSFIVDNADVIASVGVEAVATIAEGGDAKEVLQASANTLVKETVLTDMNVKTAIQNTIGGAEFVDNNIDAITQAVKAGGIALTDGKNREETIRDTFNAYRENDGQLTPELEDGEGSEFFEDIEKWYHENIEDPLEDWWQEIEPTREMFEEAGQVAVDTVNEYVIQPVTKVVESIIEGADEAVRAMPTTKEDWEQFEDTAKENASNVAGVVRETGRQAEEVYDTAEDFVKEEVAPVINQAGRDVRETAEPVTTAVRETGRAVEQGYGAAEDFVKEEVAPAIRETGRDIREAFSSDGDVAAIPEVDIPFSVEADPEITQERRGFYYDDSNLVSNPFLRGGEQQRIRSLTDMIAMEKEAANRQAKILADEEERKLRYKSVFGVNPNVQVKYNG